MLCSDFGSHDETDNRASRSENVRHQHYIRTMEERITRLDEARRQERPQREQSSPPRDARVPAKPAGHWVDLTGVPGLLGDGISVVNRLASRGFFCSIEGRHHPYGEKAIQKTVASLASACAQVSTLDGAGRQVGDIAARRHHRALAPKAPIRGLRAKVFVERR